MALTILEAAKLNPGEVVRGAVVEMFARESDILLALPFKPISGNAYSYSREGALPGVAFRGVNESYTESTGIVNPLTEALKISGGDLDVDNFILKTQGMGVRATHEAMKVKALSQDWARVFIKGDSEADPREFDGLQKRVTGTQLIAAGSTSGGDALSLAKLDELIDAVPGATHLVMSKAMRRLLSAAARTTSVSGHIVWDKDAFGRRVLQYADLPILVPYSDNGGTEPVAFDEANPGGGTAVGTSIYCVAFGDGRLTGIQNGEMDVRDLGELDTKPAFRTRVEWFAGMCLEHGRAAGRLYGIKNAAVTA
ncbi:MAG: major capsid protein [Georgenia sp.]